MGKQQIVKMAATSQKEHRNEKVSSATASMNKILQLGRKMGAEAERKRIADFIRNHAESWQRTPTFNFRIELHKLAEAIEKGNNEQS